MTYTESYQLMQDSNFRGRVQVACLKYAGSIINEPANTTAHTAKLRWANQTVQQPNQMAGQVQPPTVMDPNVQAAGAQIDDVALQGAVENTVNTSFI